MRKKTEEKEDRTERKQMSKKIGEKEDRKESDVLINTGNRFFLVTF